MSENRRIDIDSKRRFLKNSMPTVVVGSAGIHSANASSVAKDKEAPSDPNDKIKVTKIETFINTDINFSFFHHHLCPQIIAVSFQR